MLGDDATGIGVADDIAIPVIWLGAAGTWTYQNRQAITEVVHDLYDNISDKFDPSGFYYVTYTKTDAAGQVYVGRTSGYGSPLTAVKARDANHHMTGFGAAVLSTFAQATVPGGYSTRAVDPSYWAIRGSEQTQIETYRALGNSANAINGIGPNNPNLQKYIDWANRLFK